MDILQTWQSSSGSDDALKSILHDKDLNHFHSKLPLRQLMKNLLIGVVLAAVVSLVYIVFFFFIDIWQVHIALVILICFNVWVGIDSWKLYKTINTDVSTVNTLKEELEKNYLGFQNWWRVQEKFGLFIYPIGATAGFVMGGVKGSGKSIEAFLFNPTMLTILGITLLILVPICYMTARWMFNHAYGKHLKKLKLLIDELTT